ncbi:ROK family transcriptional regulator [Paenibacillus sp. P26]|nr:ROK family transcriptional regulator [Paenibacillus sp. P26]UUZ95451.1 ROK family transcriptional regulator [Paenibacillus sp. P25]
MQKHRTGDLKLIQELNRSIILNMIREHGPISRSEIAKRNHLSPSTVASAVSELIQEGLASEIGQGTSSGGRRPIMVQFSPDNHFLIGISVYNRGLDIAEINLQAEIRRSRRLTAEDHFQGEKVTALLLDSIGDFIKECTNMEKCIGISIIVPGIIDSRHGIVHYNAKLKLEHIRLKEMVESRFGIKTWVENDMNAIVLAEKIIGNFSQYHNLIYISVGSGVGAGVILNDAVLRGSRGGAGEFGHTTVNNTGAPCECGNRGCIENYISWPATRSRIGALVAGGTRSVLYERVPAGVSELTPDEFYRAVEEGDPLAVTILEENVSYMGTGIVNLVNLFNPDIIIIGGEAVNTLLLARLTDYIRRHALGFSTEGLQIYPGSLGENAELIGAASVLLQDYFRFSLSVQQEG